MTQDQLRMKYFEELEQIQKSIEQIIDLKKSLENNKNSELDWGIIGDASHLRLRLELLLDEFNWRNDG